MVSDLPGDDRSGATAAGVLRQRHALAVSQSCHRRNELVGPGAWLQPIDGLVRHRQRELRRHRARYARYALRAALRRLCAGLARADPLDQLTTSPLWSVVSVG